MLVLTWKVNRTIKIGDATIRMLKVKNGEWVRIGIDAPADIQIVREEAVHKGPREHPDNTEGNDDE